MAQRCGCTGLHSVARQDQVAVVVARNCCKATKEKELSDLNNVCEHQAPHQKSSNQQHLRAGNHTRVTSWTRAGAAAMRADTCGAVTDVHSQHRRHNENQHNENQNGSMIKRVMQQVAERNSAAEQ